MINKKYLKLLRSQNRFDRNNFIYNTIAKRIIDSIDLIKLNLNNILELGINDCLINSFLEKNFSNSNIDHADICSSKSVNYESSQFLEIDLNNLNLKNNFYDLIYSNYFLHLTDSFERNLGVIFNSLRSNSFFIGAIPDKDSMFEILNSMYETDLLLYNGVYQRNNPTLEIENILLILKKYKFDIPTIYSDTFTIDYLLFENLLLDIKKMNTSYCHLDKKRGFESKKYIDNLKNYYQNKYFKKEFILDIKINIISAWKK